MLSRFTEFLLVATSLAPVCFTFAFVEARSEGRVALIVLLIFLAVGIGLLCRYIIRRTVREGTRFPFTVTSIRTADQEITGFFIAYLLPLLQLTAASLDLWALLFVLGIIAFVALTTHTYHFNPVLGLMRYHFYEVTSSHNVSYVLITRRTLRSSSQVKEVVQMTDYIMVDSQLIGR